MTKKVLMIIIAVCFLVSCYTAYNRYRVEGKNNHVEIAIDMTEFQDLAGEKGEDFRKVADRLINSGATSIGVQEASLKDFRERGFISYMPLGEFVMNSYNISTIPSLTGASQKITDEYVEKVGNLIKQKDTNSRQLNYYSIIITPYKDVNDFIKQKLSERIQVIPLEDNGIYAIILKQKLKSNMEEIGLGFYEKDLAYAKSLGFMNVIPRIQNYPGITKKDIDSKIAQAKKYGATSVVFAGESVLGYNSDELNKKDIIQYAAQKFKENGLTAAIIEKPADEDVNKGQRGVKLFARESEYSSTKVFSVELDKQKRYNPKDIIDQWARAISERSVRIIYVKPIWNAEKDAEQVLKDSSLSISLLSKRLVPMEFFKAKVSGLKDFKPTTIERIVIITGIIAGAILLLLAFFELHYYIVYALLTLGFLGTTGVLYSPLLFGLFGDMGIKMAALTSAIVFPSLAVWYLVSLYKKYAGTDIKPGISGTILESAKALVISAAIAGMGGTMIAALLAESKYMLKLDIFRGVKVAFVAPLLIAIFLFIKYIGLYSDKDGNPIGISLQLKKLLNTSVTVKYAIAGVVVLAVVMVLLLRSGNAPSAMATDLERNFRALLENMLVARPRSKELIAFPILMFLIYSYFKNNRTFTFLVLFAGVIGLADIVNSFSHIRMTLKIAVMSSAYSVAFGIIIGAILIAITNIIETKYFKNIISRREIG